MSNVVDAARGPGRPKAGGGGADKKPSIDIKLAQHFSARVYTSGSTVSGHAIVKCPRDTPFESFDILFTGVAASRMDFVQSFNTNSVRTFMKLRMPIGESDLPEARLFEAGRAYHIPFHFVVPHQLTMSACNHGSVAPAVQDQHLRMPPTLGYWDGDDQAPDMTHIEYAVKAKMTFRPRAGEPKTTVEGKKILKVLPAAAEEPPLDIAFTDERYCLSKTKPMRKNLLGPKSGELTASSSQPGAVMVHADGFGANGTTARINLEFAPASPDAAPPKINSVAGKLISTTFFGSSPTDALPNMGPKTTYSHNQVLNYSAATNLFNTRVDKVSWSEHSVAVPRRDSGYVTAGTPEETSEDDDAEAQARNRGAGSRGKNKQPQGPPVRYRAALDFPINVPVSNKKAFVPTFHNCIMSRTYTLQLVLSVGPANTTMTLLVPIQLGVERIFEPQGEELPSFESAMAENGIDDYLRPRLMQAPTTTVQRSTLPGYEESGRQYVAVA